ncbi:MAG TPA: hypothetical protein PLQ00_01070 [Thermoguttaceae bacterium]|nr:hypothetical protein [Thermoguttaceae bacterium]
MVPVPKPFSNSFPEEFPPPHVPSKAGFVAKLLMGIGLAGGMLGIGAFVGVVVVLMSRVELTSRLPPAGTPLHRSDAPSQSPFASPTSRLSSPKPDISAGENQPISSISQGREAVGPQSPDRSQVLLQMEIVELAPARAEPLLRSSEGAGLSPSAAVVLEAMLHRHSAEESVEKNRSASAEEGVSSKSGQSGQKASEKSSAVQRGAGSASSDAKVPHSNRSAAGRPGSDDPSAQDLFRGGKNTQSFRERWGIRAEPLLPSDASDPLRGPETSNSDSSSSRTSPPAESSKGPADAHSEPRRKESDSSAPQGPVSSSPGGRSKPLEDRAALSGFSPGRMEASLGELERLGILRRISSAKLSMLHRWPAQIELVVPASANGSGGSSSAGPSWQSFCSGKLHCLAEVESEDTFRLELAAELLGASPLSERSARPSETPPVGRNGKTFGYVFPRMVCPGGQWMVVGDPTREPNPGDSVLCVLVRGEVQKPSPLLAQLPLSESELRERSAAQCRYLEALLRARFPSSRIQLSLAAGKIFVHGQTSDWRQMEEIIAIVRRRAVDQWKTPQLHAVQGVSSVSTEAAESAVVNMLQTVKVRLGVQLVELAPQAAKALEPGKTERGAPLSSLSPESRSWLQSLTDAAQRRQAAVMPAPSLSQWKELQSRKLARILCSPQLVAANGQKETLRLGAEESTRTITSADSDHSATSSPLADGQLPPDAAKQPHPAPPRNAEASKPVKPEEKTEWVVEILPELVEGEGLRLEVTPALNQTLQTGSAASVGSGVLSQAHSWRVQALLQAGQLLVVPIGLQEAGASTDQTFLSKTSPQVLLVWADSLPHDPAAGDAGSDRSDSMLARESHSGSSAPGVSSKSPPRKAEKASYEETLSPESLPPVSKESVAGSAQNASSPSPAHTDNPQQRLQALEEVLAKLFPQSQVRLRWEAERLIVEGQAAHPAEASQILAVVRAEALPLHQSGRLSVVNRLRATPAGPVQYLLRVRFVSVDAAALRRAAENVKRNSPGLVPLAGVLLDLAERGGHLVLEPQPTDPLPELLRQAESLDLIRLIAQPTFGLQPGQPAEYLLPLVARSADAATSSPHAPQDAAGGAATGAYLLWRLAPRWTEQARWQIEMIIELGGSSSRTGKESRSRLLAELEPGQTSAAAIPAEFWPGPGRLVVLCTPEMRPLPPETAVRSSSGEPGRTSASPPSDREAASASPAGAEDRMRSASETSSRGLGVSAKSAPQDASPVIGLPGPGPAAVSLPPPRSLSTPSRVPSAGGLGRSTSLAPPAAPPSGPTFPPPSSGTPSAADSSHQTSRLGLLPKLGQLFRARGDQKSSSTPGYTTAESKELPDPNALEITVPDAPLPGPSRSAVMPRVLRTR